MSKEEAGVKVRRVLLSKEGAGVKALTVDSLASEEGAGVKV